MNVHGGMMLAKGRPRGGPSGNVKPGLPPQVVLVELKNRILAALNKLSDRDTQQIALEDLESIAQSLTPEGIAMFLACLYDTDLQQKAVVRRECVKMFGTLASMHGDGLAPHLPRIVSNIVRRLKDPDSAIREVCVDVIGVLAVQVSYPVAGSASSGGGSDSAGPPATSIGVFVKPLLEALTEQNKGVQVGASMCLARVLDRMENIPTATVQRLLPRILKFMSMPGFLAKAGLLSVIGSVTQAISPADAAAPALLTALVPCTQECLDSTDWATRKAAAETLVRMAMSLGPALSPFKATVMPALEACRFDKVKPVRDSVNDAMALWKNVPGGEEESSSAGKNGGGRSSKSGGDTSVASSLTSVPRYSDYDSGGSVRTSRVLFPPPSEGAPPSSFSNASPENPCSARKRSPQISDRKTNPDFFKKLGEKNTENFDNFPIEVCGPPRAVSSREEVGDEMADTSRQGQSQITSVPQTYSSVELRSGTESGDSMEFQTGCDSVGDLNRTVGGVLGAEPRDLPLKTVEPFSLDKKLSIGTNLTNGGHSWDGNATSPNPYSPATSDFDTRVANDPSMWTAIRRHLQQIERQQAQLMDMFQDLVTTNQEAMAGLEEMVHGLRRDVEKIGHDIASGRISSDRVTQFGNNYPADSFHGTGLKSPPEYPIGTEEASLPSSLPGLPRNNRYPPWLNDKGSSSDRVTQFGNNYPADSFNGTGLKSPPEYPIGIEEASPPSSLQGLPYSHPPWYDKGSSSGRPVDSFNSTGLKSPPEYPIGIEEASLPSSLPGLPRDNRYPQWLNDKGSSSDRVSQFGNKYPAVIFNGTGLKSPPEYPIGIEEASPPSSFLPGDPRNNRSYPPWLNDKGSLISDEFPHGSSIPDPTVTTSQAFPTSPQKSSDYVPDFQGEGIRKSVSRGWDKREMKTPTRSEGPSTRSVWQSANDQARATLAAIRGAGFQGGDPDGIESDLSKLELDGLPLPNRAGVR